MSTENDLFSDDFGDIYDQLTSETPASEGVSVAAPPPVEAPAPTKKHASEEFADDDDDFGRILDEEYGDTPPRESISRPRPEKSDFDLDGEVTCKKCGTTESWGQARWCPECGYYPEMGDCVDTGVSPEKEVRNIDNWWEVVPVWGWILISGVVAMIVGSLAFRVLMPAGSVKFWVAICVLVGGLLSFWIAHFRAYITAVHKNDKLAPLDMFINPLSVWQNTFKTELPERAPRVWAGAWGLTAMLCGGVLMGGFTMDDIFKHNWADAQANTKLKMAISEKKAGADDEDDLEEAVGKMIGFEDGKIPVADRPRQDCVIIGYTKDTRGEPEALLLGAVFRNDLTYIGKIDLIALPEKARQRILEMLPKIELSNPLVKFPMEATAVDLKLMVRVHYVDRKKSGRLNEVGFDRMLASDD